MSDAYSLLSFYQTMTKYLVVEFDTNEIAVVSEKWLVKESGTDSSDDTVLWPPVKTSVKLGLALKQHAEPDNTWVSCRIIRTMYTTGKYKHNFVHVPN